MDQAIIEKFESNYVVDEATGCWNWIGTWEKFFYPCIYHGHKCLHARKIGYEIYFKPLVGKTKSLYPSCKNKSCVNPHHMKIRDGNEYFFKNKK